MELNSRVYKCQVYHERRTPRKHSFEYNHFVLLLDLDELPLLNDNLRLFSHNGRSIYNFQERDHLDGKSDCLKSRATRLLEDAGITTRPQRVLLLANPRVFGYVFNPLSVYFFFQDSHSSEPYAAICEICNTFGERKAYLIDALKETRNGIITARRTKNFYISPYCRLDDKLLFQIEPPLDRLKLKVTTSYKDETVVSASLTGTAEKLTDKSLMTNMLSYPLPTLATIGRIHWQALVLYLKGIPFARKESNPDLQTNLWRPHKSLHSGTELSGLYNHALLDDRISSRGL